MAEVWTPPPFDDVSTGETVTAAQLNALGNSLRFLKRVGFQTVTSDVSITATSVGTANQIISLGAITYEAVPHYIEFYAPRLTAAAVALHVILRDSTTVIGRIAAQASGEGQGGYYIKYPITPTAASHTYNIAAWVASAGTWTFEAGTGGTAGDGTADLNIWMAAHRVPT